MNRVFDIPFDKRNQKNIPENTKKLLLSVVWPLIYRLDSFRHLVVLFLDISVICKSSKEGGDLCDVK